MVTIIDVTGETGKLDMLRDRRPDMLEAERRASGAFATLAPFRDGNIFAAKFSGNARLGAAPERRRAGADRRRHDNGAHHHRRWARNARARRRDDGRRAAGHMAPLSGARTGSASMTATPRPTEHLTVDVADPRTLSDAERAGSSEEKMALRCISTAACGS